ncbi:MAG: hypothetical protein K2X81_15710 [Candidatus Obscuribacterales bacterium]|nr:hypothetical protein [Candidatus Obscuribacterales bacterium]
MSPVAIFCLVGIIIALLVQVSAKQVSELIAPKGPGFFAIPRTLLAVMWFSMAQFVAGIVEIVLLIVLLLSAAK